MNEVHVSDIKTFRDCRWRWDWSSNLRQNLQHKSPVPAFMLGRAVHYAMAAYYDGEDPIDAYEKYIEKDLELYEYLEFVEGDAEKSRIYESVVLGRGMVAHYVEWAPHHDQGWEILSTEHTEIWDVSKHYHLPPGRDFAFNSRFDGVWRRKSDGTLWLKEFKTTRSMKETDFIDRDPQPRLYARVAEEAFGERIEGLLYTFMAKTVPEMPRVLQSGDLSKAKNQNTTAELYMEAIKSYVYDGMGLEGEQAEAMYLELQDEYSDIINYYLEEAKEKYFKRILLPLTRAEIDITVDMLIENAEEMLDPSTPIYPAPSQMKCPRCPFRDPCLIRLKGGDYSRIIEEEYVHRTPYSEMEEGNDDGTEGTA